MTDTAAERQRGHGGIILAWTVLLASETLAQLALKAGGDALSALPLGPEWVGAALGNPWVLAGIVGYIGSFAAWMAILDRIPLSLGFPLTAAVMLLVALASWLLFGETLSPWRLFGIGLILAGIALMGRSDT